METGPGFKGSSKRLEKQGINLAISGLVVWCVIHYTTAAPRRHLIRHASSVDTRM